MPTTQHTLGLPVARSSHVLDTIAVRLTTAASRGVPGSGDLLRNLRMMREAPYWAPWWRFNTPSRDHMSGLGRKIAVLHATAESNPDTLTDEDVFDLATDLIRAKRIFLGGLPTRHWECAKAAIERAARAIDINFDWCPSCAEAFDADDEEAKYSDTYHGQVCPSCAEAHILTDNERRFIDPDKEEVYWAYTTWAGHNGFRDPEAFTSTRGLTALHPDFRSSIDYVTDVAASESWWSYRDDYEGQGLHPDGPEYDEYDEYEDDGSRDRPGVYGYDSHPYRRHGSGYFDEPMGSSRTNVPIGMEFEVRCEGDILDAMRAAGLDAWILEHDSSLDPQCGVEIVSPPLVRAQWERTVPDLVGGLLDEDTRAYNPGDEHQYGVHLTIHRQYLKPLQEARLSLFLLAEENADFVRAVAQRWGIYGHTSFDIGCYAKTQQKIRRLGGLSRSAALATDPRKVKRVAHDLGKYSPLNLKGDLAEFRIFQSSVRTQTILKDMEFVWALLHWTRPESMTGISWRHEDFCTWLSDHRKEYPTLVEYLERPGYVVKSSPRMIDNTWAHLLKPTAKAA